MNPILEDIKAIIEDLLDCSGVGITAETYLVRDLKAESIDLLELAVAFNRHFKIQVKDDELLLNRFRAFLAEAKDGGADPAAYILGKYPFLAESRVREIMDDIAGGPTLKVKDLAAYVAWRKEN